MNNKINMITLELICISNDFKEEQIDFFNIPKKYIKIPIKREYNVSLTKVGENWFKKFCYTDYDGGKYYRLKTVNKDNITIKGKSLNCIKRVIKLLEKSKNGKNL